MHEKPERSSTFRCKLAVIGSLTFAAFFISSYTGNIAAFAASGIFAVCTLISKLINNNKTLLASAALTASFLFFGIYDTVFIQPCTVLYGNTYTMSADILSVNIPDNDTVLVTAEGYADGTKVRFSFYSTDKGLARGDTVEAEVIFSAPAVTAYYNENYSYSRGIFTRAYVQGAVNVTKRGGTDAYSLITYGSQYLRDAVKENLHGDEGALLLAMFFGDKSEMSAELSSAVKRSGLSHMTAVSGMHMSLIITVLAGLLELCVPKHHSRLKFLAIFGAAAVFAVFFGMTASVRRSALMMIVYYGALLFGRKPAPLNSLGAAMLVILFTEPCACRDAGLILSVCGTFGAGHVSPRLCTALHRRFRFTDRADAFISGVCATYCTLPATMIIFGGMPLFAPFMTVAVYPFFFASMLCTLIFAASGGLLVSAALVPAGVAMKPITAMIRTVSGFRYSYIAADDELMLPFLAVSAVFIAACTVISLMHRKDCRYTVFAAVVTFCALAGTLTAQRLAMSDITKITVYSDGKNGLAAIESSSGVSAFASDVSTKLSAAARDALTERCADRFLVLSVAAEEKHGSMHSDTFDGLAADEKHCLDNTEAAYDVNGEYTVRIYEDAVETHINGVSFVFADAACAETYGAHDIAVYSGYKKSSDTEINGVTVYCDKRYRDSPHNAYYKKTVILINKNGEYLIKEK